MPNNHAFNANNSDSEEDDFSDDSDDEEADAIAAPVRPMGKVFRPPQGSEDEDSSGGDSDDASSGSELKTSNGNHDAVAQVIRPNPVAPRGKELRLIANSMATTDDLSSDDEPLVNKKTTKPQTKSAATTKKESAKKPAAKKRKEVPVHAESDSDDDCVAAVVVDDENNVFVDAIAQPVVRSKPVSKRLKKDGTPTLNPGPKKGKPAGSIGKKPSRKKKAKAPSPALVNFGSFLPMNTVSSTNLPEVTAENAEAAQEARYQLQKTVTTLPHVVSDTYTVRSFGKVKPEYDTSATLDALYSSPHAIYPVGFSCDRFEFSPVHGRVIKMRCDILDGSNLKDGVKSEAMLTGEKGNGAGKPEDFGDGPVFRVMWGEGIDNEGDADVSLPFDPYAASSYGSGDLDAVAVPLGTISAGMPVVGMRVNVRFDKSKIYGGKITKVAWNERKSTYKPVCDISILYDDGVTEETTYPDPDIYLSPPGMPPVEQGNGVVTELCGKTVRSVLATSPLEAWGKTLLSLGLIDEVIYDAALQTLEAARREGLEEARERIDAFNKKRREDRAKEKKRRSGSSIGGEDADEKMKDANGDETVKCDNADAVTDDNATKSNEEANAREAPSIQEIELQSKLQELQSMLKESKSQAKAAAVDLAHVRIATISPFAANPFLCGDDAASQELSLIAAAVKKAKSQLGNTGNKRKIVTPATMMDKSDTFFLPEIEQLIEGMPGTEYAPSYVFHANRSAGANANGAWVHEARVKHERAMQRKLERQKKAEEDKQAKAELDKEKSAKRIKRDIEKASQKRQREDEEDTKKKERVERRLAQLSLQMDDRLLKESFTVREKMIMNFVRSMNKEFQRRRKTAETVVGYRLEQPEVHSVSECTALSTYAEMVPPLSRVYDEDVIRIWDFVHSFENAFKGGSSLSIPTLDSLQDAIECLKADKRGEAKHSESVDIVKGIAINLCKAISPSLTKLLSSTPPLLESNSGKNTTVGPQEEADVSCLPVSEWTWREIARMVFIADVLTDLGYTKNEAAVMVKGYRSGGHPNSKEAKRWKKIEDSPVVMMYQQLDHDDAAKYRRGMVKAKLSVPCTPSSVPTDWRFFLHNVRARTPNQLQFIKDNVEKSLLALKKDSAGASPHEAEEHIAGLEKCLVALKQTKSEHSADPDLIKAKQIALDVLDSARPKLPAMTSDGSNKTKGHHSTSLANQASAENEPARQRFGVLHSFQLSKEQYKMLEISKEDYMVAALRLKEELERKSKGGNEEEEDDDDDDDENGEPKEAVAPTDAAGNDESMPDADADKPAAEKSVDVVNACGTKTDYNFCEDILQAPDLIRRCLAVIRALCASATSEPFIYPVDPQLYPGYYETVVTPMSLHDVGKFLQDAGKSVQSDADVETIVAEVGRKVRAIVHSCLLYNNLNKEHLTVNSAQEMLRVFERLFFDWVLAPSRPALPDLDDDKCIDHHESDLTSMVLLCDGCEGNFNMARLKPPLTKVPSGDWYCPRCVSGRCWTTVDPRLGRQVLNGSMAGTVQSVRWIFSEDGTPSLMYCIKCVSSGKVEFWGVKEVDESIIGEPAVEPISCIRALSESRGYGFGRDAGIVGSVLPLPIDPFVGDNAAQTSLVSGVFKDTISACVSLMNPPEELNAREWITLLTL